MEKKSFVGPKEVIGVTVIDTKTPSGKDIVKILFADDSLPEIMPLDTFELVVTDEPKDWNYLRDKRYEKLMIELTKCVLEADIVFHDIHHVTDELKKKLETAFDRATSYLWTKDDRQFIAGFNPMALRTLLEADAVLMTIKKDEQQQPTETNIGEGAK